jgi:hypothetical protein
MTDFRPFFITAKSSPTSTMTTSWTFVSPGASSLERVCPIRDGYDSKGLRPLVLADEVALFRRGYSDGMSMKHPPVVAFILSDLNSLSSVALSFAFSGLSKMFACSHGSDSRSNICHVPLKSSL